MIRRKFLFLSILCILLFASHSFLFSNNSDTNVKYFKFLSFNKADRTYTFYGEIQPISIGSNYFEVLFHRSSTAYLGHCYKNGIKSYSIHLFTNGRIRKLEKFDREGQLFYIEHFNQEGIKIREEYLDKLVENDINSVSKTAKKTIDNVIVHIENDVVTVLDRNKLSFLETKKAKIRGRLVNYLNSLGETIKTEVYDKNRNLIYTKIFHYLEGKLVRSETYASGQMIYYSLLYYDLKGKKLGEEYFDKDGNIVTKELYKDNEIVSKESFINNGVPNTRMHYNDDDSIDKIELFISDSSGDLGKKWILKFNSDGRVEEEICYKSSISDENNENPIYHHRIIYNDKGKKSKLINSTEKDIKTIEYIYDEENDKLVQGKELEDKKEIAFIDFDDRLTKQDCKATDGKAIYTAFFDENGKTLIKRYEYQKNGQIAEAVVHNAEGNIVRNERYFYYKDGNLKAINYYNPERKILRSERFSPVGIIEIFFNNKEKAFMMKTFTPKDKKPLYIDYLNQEGQIYKTTKFDDNGNYKFDIYTEYDEFGRKTVDKYKDQNDKMLRLTEYNFFIKPKLTVFYNNNGEEEKKVEYKYSKNRVLINKNILDKDGKIRVNIEYSESGIIKYLKEFDENAKLKVVEKYDASGTKENEYWYAYSSNGKIEYIDKYNSEGKLLLTRKYIYDKYGKVKIELYDTNGKQVKE